jgi:hypothetical protein
MGVYVSLKIMPQRISNDEWHEVYEDSLALLKACPEEMMTIERTQKYSVKRTVYSRQIEHDRNNQDKRHWHVVGDFKSRETGESFTFYYDLSRYLSQRPRLSESAEHSDIVVGIINESSDYCDVFSEKTQGHPYHIPILGVAMLIEDRFPMYAHASGDIDIHQAKKAQKYVKNLIDKDLALPVCVDAQRLFQRIQLHYHGKESIERFRTIYRGSLYEEFKTLYAICNNTFIEWFVDKLRYYKSPGQLGAIDLSMGWLSATRDLQTLCEIACLRDDGPKFNPLKFADALASTWISVDEPLRSVFSPFHKPEGATDTVMSQFGSFFFDLGGLKGRNMEFYLPEDEVLDVFSRLFPNHFDQMKQVFKTETETARKHLEESRNGVEQLVKRCEEEQEYGDGSSFLVLESFDKASPRQKIMLESMAYAAARMRSVILEEKPEILECAVEQLIKRIVIATDRHGLTLTEDAWKWLDNESDREFLQYILSLVAIDNHEQTFWNIRKGMLENRTLCLSAFEMSNDKTFMAKMETALKESAEKRA